MKRPLLTAIALLMSIASPNVIQAQEDHQQHHPGTNATLPQAQSSAPQPGSAQMAAPSTPQAQMPMAQMMQNMPEQCRAMMQNMPETCRGMMQQMQGGMMRQDGMMQGQGRQAAAQSEATKAYMAAMDKMHGPMMQGVQDADPDAAFVKGMIPHHQGAIDMAKVVLQYGKDEQTKKWADDVVREQQRETDEMQAWLKKRGQ